MRAPNGMYRFIRNRPAETTSLEHRDAYGLRPRTAIAGTTTVVFDDKDLELVLRDPVDDRVRKDVHGQAPPASAAGNAHVRLCSKQSADTLELCDEPGGQCARSFALVERRSLKEVLFGIRMK